MAGPNLLWSAHDQSVRTANGLKGVALRQNSWVISDMNHTPPRGRDGPGGSRWVGGALGRGSRISGIRNCRPLRSQEFRSAKACRRVRGSDSTHEFSRGGKGEDFSPPPGGRGSGGDWFFNRLAVRDRTTTCGGMLLRCRKDQKFTLWASQIRRQVQLEVRNGRVRKSSNDPDRGQ